MAEAITLFDLPSKLNHSWSLNTWKARAYLNFKGIQYKTVWVEYPDIKPTLKQHVRPDDTGKYSLPAVLLPDGTYIMDSMKVVEALEKQQPSPSIHLDSPYLTRLQPILAKINHYMRPELIPQVPKLILNEASVPYFEQTRAQQFGKPLHRVEVEDSGQPCFDSAQPFVKEVTAMLQENSGGPFFQGEQVTFADLVWVSYLSFVQTVSLQKLGRLVEEDKDVHFALLDACQRWLQRDSY